MNKVLIVSPLYPYPEFKDGASKIVANLLKENPYFDADLVCFKNEESDYRENEEIEIIDYLLPSKQSVVANWLLSSNPITTSRYIGNFKVIAQYIKDNEKYYDVIHIATTFLLPILNYLSDETKQKLILFPIDSLVLFNKRRYKNTKWSIKKMLFFIEYLKVKFFEKKYYKQVAKICFVSDVDAKQNNKLLNSNNSFSIPNGVDVEFFTRDDSVEREDSIIFTGNLDYVPNTDAIELLVNEIFPKVLEIYPNMKLYLVGVASDELIKKYSSDTIIVTGFVEDLRIYIDKSLLYISPLRFGSGIKNKILEAMSMEIPVIGTPVSFDGIDVTTDSVEIVNNPNSVESWLESIADLVSNELKRKEMTKNARSIIKNTYSWDGVRKQYGDFYESCISNR